MLTLKKLSLALLLVGAELALPGLVAAHAEFERSSPGPAEIIEAAPEVVTLEFNAPIEVRFSVFKVYPLDVDANITADTVAAEAGTTATITGGEALRLNGLAGALVNDVIELRGDEAARADAGLVTRDGRSAVVTLALEPELPAGTYVVMWRVLAIDTHTTQGFYLFVIGDPP